MGEQPADELRYTAFLSYSHRDAAAASRLHRRLEAYRMPKRLVGLETARGPVPERLAPIFRDREELPAATDLSETVRAALAQSGALIVLCSPHSAGSLWVAEEIKTFRELHPDRPILAAVLDGDPPDCFPAALRAFGRDGTWHEPLATDLRPNRDGMRLGLLKLVAGITGVGLDALVQRDASRRVRRVMAVTGAAMVAMLAMAALALAALNARGEAERQRGEARGLAEYMQTDLRDRLREVGRLDVMRPVNERALAYYDRQLRASNRPADQLARARVLQAIGEDELTRGNEAMARRLFDETYRTTADLLAAAPNDPERILAHGQSEYVRGRVFELRRNWPMAQRQYARFARATDRLIAVAPNNPDYMMQVAWAAIDLGNVQLNGTRDRAGAQRSYEKAIHWFGRALQVRPHDERAQLAQANAYAWLGDSYFFRQMWPQSLQARLRQYQITERLHRADPRNMEAAYRFALAQRALAWSYKKVGNRNRARELVIQAYDWSGRLTARDPHNTEWLLFRGQISCDFLFGGFDLPADVRTGQVGRDVRMAAETLTAQGNSRVGELGNCVRALH